MALIANYYENILSFLEAHHDGEEKLVFPLLRERCAGEDALVDEMEEQHEEAMALLEEALRALAAWPAGDAGSQKAAEERLVALHDQLVAPPRRGGGAGAATGRRQPVDGGVGGAAGARHGELRRRQDLADPRA